MAADLKTIFRHTYISIPQNADENMNTIV